MFGHGGWRQTQQLNNLTHAQFSCAESHHNSDSVGIAEGFGYGKKIMHIISYNSPSIELLYTIIGKSQHLFYGN
jgi:hypothetical protein